MRAKWVLGVGLLLSGCKLLDQTTFAPTPEAKPPVAAPAPQVPKVDPRTPLVVIDYAHPSPSYRNVLGFAIREAQKRDPRVQYDVVGMLPTGADGRAEQERAADVMRSIMAEGVLAERIHLGLRSAPAGSPQEIRVYVR